LTISPIHHSIVFKVKEKSVKWDDGDQTYLRILVKSIKSINIQSPEMYSETPNSGSYDFRQKKL
jgi:hypothetical protein